MVKISSNVTHVFTNGLRDEVGVGKIIPKLIGSGLLISEQQLEYDKGDPMKFWDKKYENLFNKNYNLSKSRV